MLNAPQDIKTGNNTPYAVFTPYWNKARKKDIPKLNKLAPIKFTKKTPANTVSRDIYKKILKKENPHIFVQGGRKKALNILRTLKKFNNYKDTHDTPSIPTTHISAYLKFGCISIREFAHAIIKKLGKNHPLLRQLYWHDFWMYIAYHSPFVYGHAYHKKYDTLAWSKNKKNFTAWCTGTTGFPIIDAGMRQLNTTGFMHNRIRMLVASFLTKDLHINWLWGEKYFAQKLVDYDPALNNGNWQWSASVGCDASPYFRIFNPWLQQKKLDPDCAYVKTWVKELQTIDNKIILNWETSKETIKNYPRPIVDHKKEAVKAKIIYKRA